MSEQVRRGDAGRVRGGAESFISASARSGRVGLMVVSVRMSHAKVVSSCLIRAPFSGLRAPAAGRTPSTGCQSRPRTSVAHRAFGTGEIAPILRQTGPAGLALSPHARAKAACARGPRVERPITTSSRTESGRAGIVGGRIGNLRDREAGAKTNGSAGRN